MSEKQTQSIISFTPEDRTTSVISLSSSGISESDQNTFVQEVAFVPGSSNGGTIDSLRSNRENQPLLGRLVSESDNNFPGNSRHHT